MKWKVPLFDLRLGAADRRAVDRAMATNWITMGPITEEFERRVAQLVGTRYAFAVSSGTAALHMAFAAIGVGPGDEVLCPSLSFVATANAVVMTGATPVFVDIVSSRCLHISPEDIERKITPKTKAVATVDYAGYPVDLSRIAPHLRKRGIAIVEDAAHSIGAQLNRRMCGALGDVGCFSFYSNKNITTAEGGMVVTSDDHLAGRLRLLRSHGMTTLSYERHQGHSFDYDVLLAGHNYRIDELRSALGIAQLQRLEQQNARRERIVTRYRKELAPISGLIVPFAGCKGRPTYHIMSILLPPGADRHAVMVFLREHGIQTSIHYRPIHTFTYYQRIIGKETHLPCLEAVAPRLLTLPLFPHMTEGQLTWVVRCLKEALAGARRKARPAI